MQPSFSRYLLAFGGSLVTVLIIAWAYVALAPMRFMESGYTAWLAKSTMLRECKLGEIALFGDSRLEAGVIPAMLPVPATNFGLAAGTSVEMHSAVTRAVQCPALPRQAVITLVPEHFGPLSPFFWTLTLRYGFIGPAELLQTEDWAARLGDTQSFSAATPDGLRGRVRDWLYVARFPSLSFSNLVQGRVFGRYDSNVRHYEEALQARGWAKYAGFGVQHADQAATFVPTKLQVAEFEASIALLRQHGVEVALLVMPFSASQPPTEGIASGYLDYLKGVVQRTPGVRLVDDTVPIWPDRLFADGAHLAEEGARTFTERLAACVTDGMISAHCDLGWRAEAGSPILEMQQQSHR